MYVIFFCITILHWDFSSAKIIRGQLLTRENWVFLTRFCFLSEEGTFRYDFIIPGQNSNVNLLFYHDTPGQWSSVYPSNKSCWQKQNILSIQHGQVVPLSVHGNFSFQSGCIRIKENDTYLHCSSSREFRSARPKWWFIVLADCYSQIGLNVTYQLSLTNGKPGDFWREHFSADEFYILPELLATACAYIILLTLTFHTAVQLRLRRLLHVSYKIFMASIICQFFGILLESSSYVSRALQGIDAKRTSLIGVLLESCAEMLYTVLMLLLALGYTVTKSALMPMHITRLVCFICVSIVFQLLLFIYQSEVSDPGLVLYIYESPPGYGLIVLKLFAWITFVTCCYKTSRKTTTKIRFYTALFSLGSSWFLCHPLTVLGITLLIDKWVRESIVKGCSLWIVFLGHATFLYLTRPVSTNVHFPFHIRTCQVVPADGDGQNHSYQPQTQPSITLFTVLQSSSTLPHSSN